MKNHVKSSGMITAGVLISLLGAAAFGFAESTNPAARQTKHFLSNGGGSARIGYLVYLPEGYETSRQRWPMILFLHGVGECGDDSDKLRRHGLPRLIEDGKVVPFVVVSPQCRSNDFWSIEGLGALLDHAVHHYRVDSLRVYVTGLSFGGSGTWALAMRYPTRFAAIAPLCGSGDATRAAVLKDLPVWVFHGEKDAVVPIRRSEEFVSVIKNAGGNVKFTRYPDLAHSIWWETYDNPQLFEWFLQQISGTK